MLGAVPSLLPLEKLNLFSSPRFQFAAPWQVAKAERVFGWVPVETWRDGVGGLKDPEPCEDAAPSGELVWARRSKAAAAKL